MSARSWLRAAAIGAALLTVLGSTGCGDTASPSAPSSVSSTASTKVAQPPLKTHHRRRHRKGARVVLERIVDGDTIAISTGAYVRLLQVDTPELSSNEILGDLDCADIPDSKKPIHVTGSDPYNLDGNGDGLGCTSG